MTEHGHCRYCGRFVLEADPEAELVTCCYCAMQRASSDAVEKEARRQEVEWLQRQKGAGRLAKRKARELRAMEEAKV